MPSIGDAFCRQLHFEHLKQDGFRKTRHTLVRARDQYAEHYQVQGSAWNDDVGPWTCYLNCGISFDGLPRRAPDRDFPGTHAWMRAGAFVPGAHAQYDVTVDNVQRLAGEVAAAIRACSSYFARRHGALRRAYEEGRYDGGFLADAERPGR